MVGCAPTEAQPDDALWFHLPARSSGSTCAPKFQQKRRSQQNPPHTRSSCHTDAQHPPPPTPHPIPHAPRSFRVSSLARDVPPNPPRRLASVASRAARDGPVRRERKLGRLSSRWRCVGVGPCCWAERPHRQSTSRRLVPTPLDPFNAPRRTLPSSTAPTLLTLPGRRARARVSHPSP